MRDGSIHGFILTRVRTRVASELWGLLHGLSPVGSISTFTVLTD